MEEERNLSPRRSDAEASSTPPDMEEERNLSPSRSDAEAISTPPDMEEERNLSPRRSDAEDFSTPPETEEERNLSPRRSDAEDFSTPPDTEEERNLSPRRSDAEAFCTPPVLSNGFQSSQDSTILQPPSTNTQNITPLQDCMMNSGGSIEKNTECVVGNSVATTKYPSEQSELHILGMTFKSREELLCCTKSFYSKQGYSLSIKNSKKERYLVIGCGRGGTYRDKRGIPLADRKKKSGTRLINCPFDVRAKKNHDGLWVLDMKNSSHNHEASFDMSSHRHPSCRRFSKEQILEIEKLTRAGAQHRQILSTLRLKNVDTQAVSKTIYNVKMKIKREALAHRTAIQAQFDEHCQEIDSVSLQKEVKARMEKRQREANDADSRQELEARNKARTRLQTRLQADCPSGPSGSALGASTIRSVCGPNHDEEPQTEGAAAKETTSFPDMIGSIGKDPVLLQKEVEARVEKRRREADDADSRQELEARTRLQTDCPSGSALGASTIRSVCGRNHDEDPQTEGAASQGTTSVPDMIVSMQKEVEARMEKRQREADDADSRQELEARSRLQTDCPSGSALGASTIRSVCGRNHDEEPRTEGAAAQGTTSVPDMIGSLDKERENSTKFNHDENDNQEILRRLTKNLEDAIHAASLLKSSTTSAGPGPDKEKNKNFIEESAKAKWEASSKKFEYLYKTSSKRLVEEKARSWDLQTTVDSLESDLASAKDQLEKAEASAKDQLEKAQEVLAANSEAWRCEKAAYEKKIQGLRARVIEAVTGTREQGEEETIMPLGL